MKDFSLLKKNIFGDTEIFYMAEAGNIDGIVKNLNDNNIISLDLSSFDNDTDKLNEILCELLKAYQLNKFTIDDITHEDLFAVYLGIQEVLEGIGYINDESIELARLIFHPD